MSFGVTLSQMAIGHYVSRALYVVAKLGIADLLKDGPRDGIALAAATQTHPASLTRMVPLLASVGVFEEQSDGTFALAPPGELLRSDVLGSLRALVLLFAGIEVLTAGKTLSSVSVQASRCFAASHPMRTPTV